MTGRAHAEPPGLSPQRDPVGAGWGLEAWADSLSSVNSADSPRIVNP